MTASVLYPLPPELEGKINLLVSRLFTMRDMGQLFVECSDFTFPGCVIVDYSELCISLVSQIQDLFHRHESA